jgi:hypothetical protein
MSTSFVGTPTMKETDGDKVWYMNGQYHREDGPAIEFADGDMEWWLNGQLHREDGPAIEWVNDHSDGGKEWYIPGNINKIDFFLIRLDEKSRDIYVNLICWHS